MKKVIGMGNALTDMLVSMQNNNVLEKFDLPMGSMTLVDVALQRQISESTAGYPRTLSLGGSAGNTIRAMAKLGAEVGFIGKVGKDNTGIFFESELKNLGIEPKIFKGENRSGRCLALVSPCGERTMVTFLGAALELSAEEIDPEIFDGYDCLYIEGYLVQNHSLIKRAVSAAKEHGLKIAIDLASFNIVQENLEFLNNLVKNYVDIIFANEQEAAAFTGTEDPKESTNIISEMCELTIIKLGVKGAYIKEQGKEMIHVGIMAAAKRVDTTGAGDFYAAGFLLGMSEGLTLRQCGTIGAIASGKVIEIVGTTFPEEIWGEMRSLIQRVRIEKYLF